MISQQGIDMTVHAGAGMADFECFRYGSSTRGQEIIRSEHRAAICLRLHVTSTFQWYDADLLLLQVRFGTAEALLPRRIFKPANGEELEIDFDTWKVWNKDKFEWREAGFQFCDLEVSEHFTVISPVSRPLKSLYKLWITCSLALLDNWI